MSYPICADAVIATPPYVGEFITWLWISGIFMGFTFGFLFGVLARDILVRYWNLIEATVTT